MRFRQITKVGNYRIKGNSTVLEVFQGRRILHATLHYFIKVEDKNEVISDRVFYHMMEEDKGHVLTHKKYDAQSELSKSEKNDCFVRAVASACDVQYEKAHSYVKEKFKRKDGDGTRATYGMIGLTEMLGKKVEHLGIEWSRETGHEYYCGKRLFNNVRSKSNRKVFYTVGKFLEDYQEGTYIILIRKHAFTIIDGIVHGNTEDSKRLRARILNVYKLT